MYSIASDSIASDSIASDSIASDNKIKWNRMVQTENVNDAEVQNLIPVDSLNEGTSTAQRRPPKCTHFWG
jgi:hypothetical protein